METKSRYEVIAELEQKKRNLITERDSFQEQIKTKKREIRDLKRELEDEEQELKEFIESVDDKKQTIKDLILSIDNTLERFNQSQSQKKQ